jgi:hypothetical protein
VYVQPSARPGSVDGPSEPLLDSRP